MEKLKILHQAQHQIMNWNITLHTVTRITFFRKNMTDMSKYLENKC